MNFPILKDDYLVETDINKLLYKLMINGLYSIRYNNFNSESCMKILEENERKIKEDIDELKRNNDGK